MICKYKKCSGLTNITIPNSVTTIRSEAFRFCSGLTSVTIGNSVTSIGWHAFDGVDIPTVVSLIEEPFSIEGKSSDYRTFSLNTFNNATLYVPAGTIEKYKATNGWKDFLFIEVIDTEGIYQTKASKVVATCHNGQLTIEGAEEGAAISIYDTSGRMVGSARASAETTNVSTTLHSGDIGIVKIGEKAVKVQIR